VPYTSPMTHCANQFQLPAQFSCPPLSLVLLNTVQMWVGGECSKDGTAEFIVQLPHQLPIGGNTEVYGTEVLHAELGADCAKVRMRCGARILRTCHMPKVTASGTAHHHVIGAAKHRQLRFGCHRATR
jgi:hypothetical protein